MNKSRNLKIENLKKDNHNTKTYKISYQRDILKSKIMEKFDINSNDAEKIILEIEKKEGLKFSKNNHNSNNYSNSNLYEPNETSNISTRDITPQENNNFKTAFNTKNQKINNQHPANELTNDNTAKSKKILNSKNNSQKMQPPQKNVDSIIDEILPDYNKQVSIELNHVDLTFEVQNEKIDTIKETFIRTLKRNKTKKIKIHALKDISFKIYKGEKIGIIGYNGAGKSTLLNVITGIYSPDNGNVITHGNVSPLLSLGAGFDVNFSGRKNIFLNGAVLGYDKKFLESKVDEIIEFSELGEFIDIPIKNYSSGMLAKLGFSIATAVNPDILIIDEILGVGDVTFQKKSADKMKSLMDGGTTVILVSHSITQIRELCDKAIWIDNGYLKDMGEVNTICDKYLKDAEKASNEQLANIKLFE